LADFRHDSREVGYGRTVHLRQHTTKERGSAPPRAVPVSCVPEQPAEENEQEPAGHLAIHVLTVDLGKRDSFLLRRLPPLGLSWAYVYGTGNWYCN
jgi:hypothetical protein